MQEELKQVDEVIGVVSSLKEKEIPAIHPDIFNDEISPSGKDVFHVYRIGLLNKNILF